MPIKKFKPQSPDPSLGKIKGDTEFARLGHLNNLVDQINGTNLVGPQGPIGPQGIQGPQGTAGASVTLLNSYPTYADFLAGAGGLPGDNIGDAHIILDDGSLYVWNGTAWFDAGDIKGPTGDQGPEGPQGIQGNPGPSTILYSGTFFDNTTQTNGGATTANLVAINSTQTANGLSLATNAITVANAGVYFVSASVQLAFTGGASNYNVTIWYTVNDVVIPNSAFTFTTTV